jgi:hypothetical protein
MRLLDYKLAEIDTCPGCLTLEPGSALLGFFPRCQTLGDQTGNLSVRFSFSQDEEPKWSATPLPAWHHASREVESHWKLLCQPCMAY